MNKVTDISARHPDFEEYCPAWRLIGDVTDGELKLKKVDEETPGTYLPVPNLIEATDGKNIRYEQYLCRAVLYNATARTLAGLVGIAHKRAPRIEMPTAMEGMRRNADGTGSGLMNQGQRTLESVIGPGRSGLWVDYPRTTGPQSVADMRAGGISPRIISYQAGSITNWRTSNDGVLELVVIEELIREADGYGYTNVKQWRELALGPPMLSETQQATNAAGYIVRTWRQGKDDDAPVIHSEVIPTRSDGTAWDIIPFQFVGSIDNNPDIDRPPMYDLAAVNLGHYRNSADIEEAGYLVGQPTGYASGIDENYIEEVWKGRQVYFGSREFIPLPENGQLGIVQAEERNLLTTLMDKKEAQMVGLGARLLAAGPLVVKTAEQSRAETAAAHSVLSLACVNVGAAYEAALEWSMDFVGATGEVRFAYDTDFAGLTANPQLITALVGGWQTGAIPASDLWAALRQLGVIDDEKTDEDIRDQIDADTPPGLRLGGGFDNGEGDDNNAGENGGMG